MNPKHDTVEELPCYASVDDLPGRVDLAVLAINKNLVLRVVEQCGDIALPAADSAIVIFRPPLVYKEAAEVVASGILRVVKENPGKPVLVCTLSKSSTLARLT